ncbi:MAG TPA: addiction module protein [Actinomycetota bacterium]
MKPAIDLQRLTSEERLDLIEELWESLDDEQRDSVALTPDQVKELDRRLDDLEREGVSGLTPDEVRARLEPPS